MCFELDSVPPIPVIRGAAVSHEDLTLQAADGNRFAAFAATPEEPSSVGVVILPDVRGLYRRHRERFALVRNTLIAATGIALSLYVAFPVAPPRLAALGFVDTVSHSAKVNLSSDLLGSLYNPFAAVPSLHFGYALLVGVTLAAVARRPVVRVLGALYPALMLFVIVATGNHFFFDAAAGALAIGAGYLIATWVGSARREPRRRPAAASAAVTC